MKYTLATLCAALACAGLDPADLDLIVYGSCSNDEQVPNSASGVQALLDVFPGEVRDAKELKDA